MKITSREDLVQVLADLREALRMYDAQKPYRSAVGLSGGTLEVDLKPPEPTPETKWIDIDVFKAGRIPAGPGKGWVNIRLSPGATGECMISPEAWDKLVRHLGTVDYLAGLESAWGLISNAVDQTADWRAAAVRWRDEYCKAIGDAAAVQEKAAKADRKSVV